MTGFVDAVLLDIGGEGPEPPDRLRWAPAVIRAKQVDDQVDHLATMSRRDSGLRCALVAHPRSLDQGRGLAPGIRVSIEVLAPGERALPAQANSTSLAFCMRGDAEVVIDGHRFAVSARDVWTTPPMAAQSVAVPAGAAEPFVFLRFSNASLLELLGVHWSRPTGALDPKAPGGVQLVAGAVEPADAWRAQPDGAPGTVAADEGIAAFGPDGPWRLQYERMVNPPWVGVRPWHWPWKMVKAQLDTMATLDQRYRGRRVCLPYDPATGRHNGTTSTLVASMCLRPAKIVDRAHRHVAAAVNYFFEGEGWSTIGDEHVEWGAGDLMLAAPGWTAHHHVSGDQPVYQMAVQDNPLHLAMGSLLWQESLANAPKLLGTEPGYSTNRHELDPADS